MTWLGWRREPVRVGLRPRRDVRVALSYEDAYARVLDLIERVLGANVYADDRGGGTIEAAFGLVRNERIRVTFERAGDRETHIRIEGLFPAGVEIPMHSRAVDALADALGR